MKIFKLNFGIASVVILISMMGPDRGIVGQQATPAAIEQADAQRILAITLNPVTEPPAADNNWIPRYVDAINAAYKVGARGNVATTTWAKLEPSSGQFSFEDLDGTKYLDVVGFQRYLLGIQTINTVKREVPAELNSVPFDSAEMKQRFHKLIEALQPHMLKNIHYLSIGNEVDVYLNNTNEWDQYQNFYEDAVDLVHKTMPGVLVGTTVTFSGTTADEATTKRVLDLNRKSDILIMTYYPLMGNFTVRPPDVVFDDMQKMLDLAGERPLVLQEVGYPASEILNSSEKAQAQFVTNVYGAWQKAGNRIPLLSFFLLNDINHKTCDELVSYYGISNNRNFWEYICTLGFHKEDGTPRAVWNAFVNGAVGIGGK